MDRINKNGWIGRLEEAMDLGMGRWLGDGGDGDGNGGGGSLRFDRNSRTARNSEWVRNDAR